MLVKLLTEMSLNIVGQEQPPKNKRDTETIIEMSCNVSKLQCAIDEINWVKAMAKFKTVNSATIQDNHRVSDNVQNRSMRPKAAGSLNIWKHATGVHKKNTRAITKTTVTAKRKAQHNEKYINTAKYASPNKEDKREELQNMQERLETLL